MYLTTCLRRNQNPNVSSRIHLPLCDNKSQLQRPPHERPNYHSMTRLKIHI